MNDGFALPSSSLAVVPPKTATTTAALILGLHSHQLLDWPLYFSLHLFRIAVKHIAFRSVSHIKVVRWKDL